jgi:hypothetical protein
MSDFDKKKTKGNAKGGISPRLKIWLLITQKKKKCTFRSTSLFADDVLYWQDKIVLRITFVMWNLLTLFYLNSKLAYVHSL